MRTTRLAGRQAGTEPAGVKRGQIPVSARSLWHYEKLQRCSQTPSVGFTRVNLQGSQLDLCSTITSVFVGLLKKKKKKRKKSTGLYF